MVTLLLLSISCNRGLQLKKAEVKNLKRFIG
jgi:hypothetical protein